MERWKNWYRGDGTSGADETMDFASSFVGGESREMIELGGVGILCGGGGG